ncbi:MAG: MFS transporter [Alphaproteobacteria bacterium]|nr:MFS transporter [Alphaproteobacteria bacterium]
MKPNLLIPFSIGHFANDLVPIGMYLIIPAFGTAMGLTPAEIGLLFMIHYLGSSLAYFPAGLLADHVANRGILLALTFFWVGVGYFLASFMEGFWAFAILIAVAGMGDAAWHPIATGVLAQIHKARRAYALGVHAIGGHLSEVIALPVVGLLLAWWDWRVAIQILVIPTLLMGVVFLFIAPKVPRHVNSRPTRADFSEIWKVWATKAGVRVIVLFTLYNMALYAIITMMPLYLKDHHAFGWQDTSIAMAVMMLFGAMGQPWMGKISDQIGRKPISVMGNAIAAVAALVAYLSTSIEVTLISLGVALIVGVAIRAVLLAAAVDHAGNREGTSLGLAFAFMDGFAASAALLAGMVGEIHLAYAFLLASGFSVLATVLALSMPWRRAVTVASEPAAS